MSLHRRWLLLAALAATAIALPVPDETDTSSKLLGSSVVTSVSVVMGEEDGNDAVKRVTDDLPASTVDMLKPDGFQFYTVDEKGQLITRQMTESEIHSIIAAGGGPFPVETQDPQKVGDPASGEMKVADVVQNVQNVLKGELNKPATVMGAVPTIPGHANDEWSSILPSILGGDSESAPVTFETGEPDQEPKRNATVTSAKPNDEKVGTSSVPEVDEKRPMIPVPVITADSVKDPPTTESKPVYEMLNTISADEVKEQSPESDKTVTPTTQTKVETPSINLEAPVESEKPVEEAPTTVAATVEEEIAEIEKVIDEIVSETATPEKKPEEEGATVFEKIPVFEKKDPETATVIVPSPTIIVPEAAISEDEVEPQSEKEAQAQTETEPTKKPETMLTELADSVSSMISQVSEVMPSMVPIPQKPDEELIKRVEDGVTVKSKIPEATTETVEVSSPPKEETKKPEIVMVEIKTPELPEPSSTPKTEVEEEEKVEIVLKDKTESGGEVPIVRVDITEAKPTVAGPENESPGESSVVRIQLANPTVTKVNEMIDSAPAVEVSPVEVKPISFNEKILQTPASNLIAGDPEVEKQESETQAVVTKDDQETASTSDPVVESTVNNLSDKKPEQVIETVKISEAEIPQEKPEVVKEDETKSSMVGTLEVVKTEEKKPVKPVETENVEATTDKVEPVTQETITESSVKIVESSTIAAVKEVEEPVKDTSATPPEVVVVTKVDVQPMKAAPEAIEESVKEEATPSKPEEKPVEETVKVESATPTTVKTEAKPEAETPSKDVESKPVAPLKSDEKPEEENLPVIKESEKVALGEPAEVTPKPLESEDKPEAEIPSKEAEIEPLKAVVKPEEEKPLKNVESEPAKPVKESEESTETEIKPVTPLKSEEKPVEETPSKNVDSKPAMPLESEKKPVDKEAEVEPVTTLKLEEKPVETPLADVGSKPVMTVESEEKPVEITPPAMTPLKSDEKIETEIPSKSSETEPTTPLKSEEKPVKETPSKNPVIEPMKPLESEEKPVAQTPLKNAETEAVTPSKSQEKPVNEAPPKNAETEPMKPLKSEKNPVEQTPSKNAETEKMKPLKSEVKPVEQTPLKNAETKKVMPSKSEEKPVDKMPSENADTDKIEPLKSDEKPVKETPSNNVETESLKPLISAEKPEDETPSKKPSESEPMKPLKSEQKPAEQTPSKNAAPEEMQPVKSEEKPVKETPSKNAETEAMKPVESEEKPVKETPSKNAETEAMKPVESEEKPVKETPSKNSETEPMKPLKSGEKPVEQTPLKSADTEKIKPLKSEEKPEEETPFENSETEPMNPLKSEEKPVEQTLGEDAEIKPTTPLKSEEKPQAENPAIVVESKPAIDNTKSVINDKVPVEQAMPGSTQPDKQADHVPDVSTPALKMPEKIETQTVTVVQDTEKQTEVLDVKVETPEVKPEVVPAEETKPQKDAAEVPMKVDAQESTVPEPAKDQVPVPLVRVDVSPEKNQTVSPATEVKAPEADETLKKTEIPVVESSSVQPATDIKLPAVEEVTKKTEESQDSVVESSNIHSVEPAILESSSKASEAVKTEKTEETVEEPANTIVEQKIPEVIVTAEPASTVSPTVTKVESEEVVKPAVKVETTPPAKTQEVRIQVNDTAVLVTQQKVPQKVDDEKKKVEPVPVTDSKKPEIEASSQAPERTTLTTVSQEQNDKPISQEDVTKIASEKKKPTTDPFVKLGERKPAEAVKTSNANKKKPEDKWTLIPQSEPIVKQQQTTEANKNEQPSVSLEAHQSSVNLKESTRDLDKDIGEFAKLCNELAFSFWIAANKGLSTARSLALSPFGMTSMLAMVFLGARGPTSGQMNDVLKLDDVVTFNPHLVFQNITDSVNLARGQGVANAAFVRELFADRAKAGRILPFYKERAQQFYDGHIEEVNFASISDLVRRRTNLLVRRQTGGRIRDFVKGNVMSLRSPLAALSANVFQTDCTGASSEGRDGEMYFAVLPAVRQRKLVPVPATVWRSGVLAGYEPGLDATVVSLGGIGSLVSTIFALPGQQGLAAPGDSLDHLERRLLAGAVADGVWDRLLKVLIPRLGLEVQVPKFSHRSVVNATAALKRMGLDELFSRHADLKGVNGIGNDLHLADMLQINLFSTCGDEVITGGRHHVEIYPASPFRGARDGTKSTEALEEAVDTAKTEDDNSRVRRSPEGESTAEEQLIADVGEDRAFRSPLTAASKGKQTDRPLLKLDRPFLYFVRHNPTGMILHMGRFNPRLMP